MPRFEVRQSSRLDLTSYAGLALLGQCFEAALVEPLEDTRIPGRCRSGCRYLSHEAAKLPSQAASSATEYSEGRARARCMKIRPEPAKWHTAQHHRHQSWSSPAKNPVARSAQAAG